MLLRSLLLLIEESGLSVGRLELRGQAGTTRLCPPMHTGSPETMRGHCQFQLSLLYLYELYAFILLSFLLLLFIYSFFVFVVVVFFGKRKPKVKHSAKNMNLKIYDADVNTSRCEISAKTNCDLSKDYSRLHSTIIHFNFN